jgi:DNA-binding transcriptional MerR regulator
MPRQQQVWKVGELAGRTGLTLRTLHHYDRIGLLSPCGRTGSNHGAGHRLYTAADVARLQQILSLKMLGFSLEQIREYLSRGDYDLRRVVQAITSASANKGPIRPPIVRARVAAHLELALARKTLAAQNQVLRDSLAMAAHVQRSLLLKTPPGLPGLEVAGRMIPCDDVGGDYLDFLTAEEFAGRGFGIAVEDVSGHGASHLRCVREPPGVPRPRPAVA